LPGHGRYRGPVAVVAGLEQFLGVERLNGAGEPDSLKAQTPFLLPPGQAFA
jgi:hypothetical protein